MSSEIIDSKKTKSEVSEDDFYLNPANVIPPELLNNIGVLRMNAA